MSLVVKNITKKFGEQIAVNSISFTVPKGQIVGFLGPNGAGKSTTMKMITGYLNQDAGSIAVCDIDTTTHAHEARKKIGYLPESNPLYYDMYVREYLDFLAGIHQLGKTTNERIEEMISLTGLQKESKKKIGALSKGYKQRVGLAQAMLHNPEVLILDEPTSGLDPNQIVDIRDLIINLGKEKTVLLSTHIMQEVNAMCDRVIIINNGNIVADNSIQDLKNTGSTTEQILVLETKQKLNAQLFSTIKEIEKIENVNDTTLKFFTQNADITRKKVFEICMNQNLDILNINSNTQNLEDIFRTLTHK